MNHSLRLCSMLGLFALGLGSVFVDADEPPRDLPPAAQTTVDFARKSRVVTWLLGGLNFQIEHHLFPRICHVNYPAISKIVEDTCREFGVRYAAHKSFWAGLASHYRWLRHLGRPPQTAG